MSSLPKSLTVIIVNFNCFDVLATCLDSVLCTTRDLELDIVVVDNASSEGSLSQIAIRFPAVKFIQLDRNCGFGAANNIAAAAVQTDRILFLNPDTEVHPQAIERLLRFSICHPRAGIVGGRARFADGSLNPFSCANRPTLWSVFCRSTGISKAIPDSELFNPELIGAWQRDSVRHVDVVVGCFLMITNTLWTKLGGFDERYFLFGEEVDLCLRAARFGYSPMITPEAEITHHIGRSIKPGLERSLLLARARTTLIRQHWSPAKAKLGLGLLWMGCALRAVAWAFRIGQNPDHRMESRDLWRRRHEWFPGY